MRKKWTIRKYVIFYISELCVLSRHCIVCVCVSAVKLLLAVSIAAAGLGDGVSSDRPAPPPCHPIGLMIFIVCCCFFKDSLLLSWVS